MDASVQKYHISHSSSTTNKQILAVPRTPLHPTFNRFNAHILDATQPHQISIHATPAAILFCVLMFLSGIFLLLTVFIASLPTSFIAGAMLLLVIGSLTCRATMQGAILQKESNHLILVQQQALRKPARHSYALSDIVCIQLLQVIMLPGTQGYQDADVKVTTYEVNLILRVLPPERIWLYNNRNLSVARNAAEKIASFLGVTVLDHSKDF